MSPTDTLLLLGGGLTALNCILGATKAHLNSRYRVADLRADSRDASVTMSAAAIVLVCLTVSLGLRIADGSAPAAGGAPLEETPDEVAALVVDVAPAPVASSSHSSH